MSIYLRGFWLSFSGTMLLAVAALHFWWSAELMHLPARPPFPLTGDNYVAYYGTLGPTSHYLFRHGLFGMQKQLQASDVFLVGSSHVEFGLSAGLLSRDLSQAIGHPVRVYNLGTEMGEALPFANTVFLGNQIKHKAAVVDLYIPYGAEPSTMGRRANASSTWYASACVGNVWLGATEDWLLDPWLPHFQVLISPVQSLIRPIRALKLLVTRRWDNGDMVEVWKPEAGGIYAHSPSGSRSPYREADPAQGDHTPGHLTAKMMAKLEESHIRAVYTQVPYDSDYLHPVPAIAQPYVAIPTTNLELMDTMHLDGSSRDIATEALFQGIKEGGFLSLFDLGSGH